MDSTRFDDVVKRLARQRLTRLDALRGLMAGAAVGVLGSTLASDEADARKKAKKGKKNKKSKKNKRQGAGSNGGKEKVAICHCPPGNPENCHTIYVGASAVAAHQANHNDVLGECGSAPVICEDIPANCEVLRSEAGGCVFACESASLDPGPLGWAGWSCPAGSTVVEGSTHTFGDVFFEGEAEPGAAWTSFDASQTAVDSGTYPDYPHYTFDDSTTPPETGYVVQNNNVGKTGVTISVACLFDCTCPGQD